MSDHIIQEEKKEGKQINLIGKNSSLIPFWICLRLDSFFLLPKSPAITLKFSHYKICIEKSDKFVPDIQTV